MSWSYRDAHDDFDDYEPRECDKCIHRIAYNDPASGCKKGCSAWECCFEEKPPMTIEDAIETLCQIDWSKADEGKDEMQVEKEDKAFDLIIATVNRYIKRDCAEWEDWVDGATGRLTNAGKCNKCGTYNLFKTKFCPHCGRQMREWKKTEESK